MSAKIIVLNPHMNRINQRAVSDAETSALAELRRARIRIAQLESSLTQAIQDSLNHYNRAREAERILEQRDVKADAST